METSNFHTQMRFFEQKKNITELGYHLVVEGIRSKSKHKDENLN